ncbi:hypothetical protein N7466_010574 [Penicillium verhagenii]|uniref:uncharacterized protein n=1 Tax=Penicillium verhagenii TaxID=1562060 RepID=UPI002544E93B|nr:uncharacterized protein N7466_010574 [Penicillium verhagenii]KAJ5918582.1 hypothetical protein N7466_010574 [Penicillium verhagenii]
MPVDKIRVEGDERVKYESATLNGRKYGYLLSQPKSGKYRGTIFLIHGFPDLSISWRYQIPMLVNMGLRVVAPDCLGYGRTEAPEDYIHYGHKACADDMKALATHLGESKIILGGHDWGAFLAYRIALWHPDLITHLFSVCVPYSSPKKDYLPLEEMAKTIMPNFGYQIQFASGELEKVVQSKEEIKQFLTALHGGRTPENEFGFEVEEGVLLDRFMRLRHSRLLSEEELEYYATEYSRNGIHGPLNWYRTRELNFEDELSIVGRRITIPTLFIQGLRDLALPPHLGKAMGKQIPDLVLKQVDTAHWALWEKPEEVNAILAEWLKDVAFAGKPLERL